MITIKRILIILFLTNTLLVVNAQEIEKSAAISANDAFEIKKILNSVDKVYYSKNEFKNLGKASILEVDFIDLQQLNTSKSKGLDKIETIIIKSDKKIDWNVISFENFGALKWVHIIYETSHSDGSTFSFDSPRKSFSFRTTYQIVSIN